MRMMISAVFFLICSVTSAAAEFRCPTSGKIVHEGENPYEVQSKCGAPTARTPIERTTRNRRGTATVSTAEEWTYDFGPNYFIQKLLFEDGRLTLITSGGYGSKNVNLSGNKKSSPRNNR